MTRVQIHKDPESLKLLTQLKPAQTGGEGGLVARQPGLLKAVWVVPNANRDERTVKSAIIEL